VCPPQAKMPDQSPQLEKWVASSIGADGYCGGWVTVGRDGSELLARVHQCFLASCALVLTV
jgi:hypothetical protein